MELNGNFGMEYVICQNGIEWNISQMEWKTIFHSNSVLDFAHDFTEKYDYADNDIKKCFHQIV